MYILKRISGKLSYICVIMNMGHRKWRYKKMKLGTRVETTCVDIKLCTVWIKTNYTFPVDQFQYIYLKMLTFNLPIKYNLFQNYLNDLYVKNGWHVYKLNKFTWSISIIFQFFN